MPAPPRAGRRLRPPPLVAGCIFKPRGKARAETKRLDVDVSDEEMAQRHAAWQMPPYKATRGTLYKYIKNVKNASEGCVTDE